MKFVSKKIFWNNLNNNQSNSIDLSAYVEINKEKIRQKYLSIIKSISHTNVDGLNILDISQISQDLNLFESSLVEEKSIYKSKSIILILKVIALESILKNRSFQQYEIFNVEKENINTLKKIFFKKKNIIYHNIINNNYRVGAIEWCYDNLPNIIKVIYQVFKSLILIINLSKINIKFQKVDYLFFSNTYYLKYFFKSNVKYENRLIGDVANIVHKKDKAIIICHCDKSYASEKKTQKILLNSSKNFQLISLNTLFSFKILIKSFIIYICFFLILNLDILKTKLKKKKFN